VIVPRPIGWISTVDAEGTDNLAPYSFFQGVIEDKPPVVLFSAEDAEDGKLKHSAKNVLETEEFVWNLVTEGVVEQMDATSDEIPPGESEFAHAGLTREASKTVSPPRVAEAKAHFECTLYDTMRIGDHTVLFGQIQHIHVVDEFFVDGEIDVRNIDAVGRLAGSYYTHVHPFPVE
jgi:flavin reductase (DIM6/NTAB) family NADH-FMN oxidoreductase RutF